MSDDEGALDGVAQMMLGEAALEEQLFTLPVHGQSDAQLRLMCLPSDFQHTIVGLVVWEGAKVLASALGDGTILVGGKRVLELGAGCGLPGILCSLMNARRVVLTDFDSDVLEVLNKNVAMNSVRIPESCEVNVCKLDWSLPVPSEMAAAFDILLGTDVIYDPNFILPMFRISSSLLCGGGSLILANGCPRFVPKRQQAEQAWTQCGFVVVNEHQVKNTVVIWLRKM
ncbi:hypothetical protein Pelo_8838 [Pelomyxa schiedti]|nr:hypothetical protein Pelo_8838 [Pelomyxa schiedti]